MPRPRLRVQSPAIDDAPPHVSDLWQSARSVRQTRVPWLLPRRIVGNGLCVVEGDMGVGKSTFLAGLAAAVTTGRAWLGRKKGQPTSVIWLSGEEDNASAVRPRLDAAGADLDKVHFPSSDDSGAVRQFAIPAHLPQLTTAVRELGVSLVVLDPMVTYLGVTCDLNHEGEVRAVLDQVNRLCIEAGTCVVMTRHLKKDRSGPRLLHGIGSVAIGATARSVLVIDRPDLRTPRRVLRVVRCSLSGGVPPVEYALDADDGPPVMTRLRELAPEDDDASADLADLGERDVRADAMTLLRASIGGEWVSAAGIIAEANAAGIGERTLRKAKAELAVRSRRLSNVTPAHWEWGPPSGGF